MKKAEESALPDEFDRRLKLGIDRLKEVRETAEELSRIADLLAPLLGVSSPRRAARAAPPPRQAAKAVESRRPEQPTSAPPAPAKAARPSPSSAPAAQPESEEIPAWRKLFPELSAKVPPAKVPPPSK